MSFNGFMFNSFDKAVIDSNFNSRKRHFSSFLFKNGNLIMSEKLSILFNHKQTFHTKFSDSKLSDLSIDCLDFLIPVLSNIISKLPISSSEYAIGINQVRVICEKDKPGATAPSFHQDGYDYSLHLCINRSNIINGESKIALDSDGNHIKLSHILQSGEYIFFDDKNLFHTATQILPLDTSKVGYRDMVIVDFIKL